MLNKKRIKYSILMLAITTFFAAIYFSFNHSGEDQATLLLSEADVAEISMGSIGKNIKFTGSLKPWQQATLNAHFNGEIQTVLVKQGDQVRAGEALAQMDTRDVLLRLQQAQAALLARRAEADLAQQKVAQLQKLRRRDFASATDLDTAKSQSDISQAQVDSAIAALKQIEQQHEDALIVAPFDGYIAERLVDAGQSVAAGTPILKIVEVQKLELEALIPANDISLVSLGMRVRFRVSGQDAHEFTGKVTRISPLARQDNRRVPVFIEVDNSTNQLLAGMFVQGQLLNNNPVSGLTLPLSSLRVSEHGWNVFLIKEGRLHALDVAVLATDESQAHAIIQADQANGLDAGDWVLLAPTGEQVNDGRPVKITQVN